MIKKGGYLLLAIVFLMLIIPLASAGFFSDFWGKITGKATDTTEVSITVSGPHVVNISVMNATMTGTDVDPELSSNKTIKFFINVSDIDGYTDVNTSSVNASFSFHDPGLGEATRTNSSCISKGSTGSYSINFSCSINMTYFDAPGLWTITVYARDLGNKTHITNTTQTFDYDSLQGVALSPATLTWASLDLGAKNSTSNNDPSLINNTGNFNFTTIDINATNLPGQTTPAQVIPAANFSVGNSTGEGDAGATDECGGAYNDTIPQHGVYKIIDKAILSRGDYLVNKDNHTGQEQIFFCVKEVPFDISSQTYATIVDWSWTIRLV